MTSKAKVALVGVLAGAVAAAGAALLPAEARLPTLVGLATAGFVVHALRERAALRGLNAGVRTVSQRVAQLTNAVRALSERVPDQAGLTAVVDPRFDELARDLHRVQGMVKELAALDAASTSDLVDRLESLRSLPLVEGQAE